MFHGVNSACDRCGQEQASLAHTFWSSPNITAYWTNVFGLLSDVCGAQLRPDPMLALFGIPPVTVNLVNKQKTVIKFVSVLARRLILLHWNKKKPQTFFNLLHVIMKHIQLEKIKFEIKGKVEDFHLIWDRFLEHWDNFKHN